MILRRRNVGKSVIALLVFSLSQFFVPSSLTQPGGPAPTIPVSAVPLVGRLEVHRGRTIQVDRNDVESGVTILDGQTLETSSCVSATVNLLPVAISTGPVTPEGQVDLATNTKVVINYSAGRVKVTLLRGCARLRVAPTLDATIVTPDGAVTRATQPDTLNRVRGEVCYPKREQQEYTPVCIPPIVWWGGGAAAVATTLAVVLPCHRGADTSPVTPQGPCV